MAENKDNIHSGHRNRLRDELLACDFEGVHENKLLEALLFYSIPRRDTNEIAHALREEFGSVGKIMAADYEDIAAIEGVGENTAFLIKLSNAIYKCIIRSKFPVIKSVTSLHDSYRLFYPYFFNEKNEKTYVAFLDNSSKIICIREMAEGAPNKTFFDKRKISEIAVKNGATGIIVAHNHPNGTPNPSKEDIMSTKALQYFMEQIQVTLLDHLIFADNKFSSLRQSELLKD